MLDKNTVIDTERLLIRPFCDDDSEALYNILKEPEMFKYTPDEPWKSIEESREFIKFAKWLYESEHPEFRYFFAAVEKEMGKLIGYCGIGGISYSHSENEVFYGIAKEYWGNGYASECGKAMLEYGFIRLGLSKIIGAVHPENTASIRVMEKIGLRRIGQITNLPEEFPSYNGNYLFAVTRDEYISR